MRARRKKPKRTRRQFLICVDPGIAGTGVAVLSYGPPVRLIKTMVIRSNPEDTWVSRCVDIALDLSSEIRSIHRVCRCTVSEPLKLYVETPKLWGGSARSLAAADDLLKLSALVGMIAYESHLNCIGCGVEFIEVPVHVWKGQLPKAVVKKRVMEAFGLKKIPNHTADAAGIGLWVAGRM